MTPIQTQEAIARGVAQYLVVCARNTSTYIGDDIPPASEGVGLHVVARGNEPPDVDRNNHTAEIGWELVDEVTQAAQTMLARELTTDEGDDLLTAAFGIAPAVVELARRIIEEAMTRQGGGA